MIKWQKRGAIFKPDGGLEWSRTHAQTPVVDTEYDDKWRVYYSTRGDDGKSSIGYIDVEPGNPSNVLYVHDKPILTKGKPGDFDDCGVMPTYALTLNGRKCLYYIGWTQRITVPYHNSIGIASLDEDGKWNKYRGPLTGPSIEDPYFQGTACVMPNFEFNLWQMWYLSAVGWVRDDLNNKMEPRYHIKYATSSDGFRWTRRGHVAIELEGEAEGGIASAAVIKRGKYMMWYCYRNTFDFRDSKKSSYRIGYAESSNGQNWVRKDNQAGIERSESGWDSEMMCYPYVIHYDNKIYMFYNGNGFGETGFGYAVSADKNTITLGGKHCLTIT
jgi:hypothetical protein